MDNSYMMLQARPTNASNTGESMRMADLPPSGHVLAMNDRDNPQNLPKMTKIHVSGAAFALAFVV